MVTLPVLAALAGVALVAGFVDSIAGGGGLLTVPALVLAGLDPRAALATNKMQGTVGTASAVAAFARRGRLEPRGSLPMVAMTFLGAVLGVFAVRVAPLALLNALLPVLLIAVALWFALSPRLSEADARARMPALAFTLLVAPLLGFYDGVFGPGTGAFMTLGFVALRGFGLVRATANTKLLNFTSNGAAFLVFALQGTVVWTIGAAMAVGQLLGAQIGSHMVIRHGGRLVRPLVVVVCLALAARLLLDPSNPLRQFVTASL